MMGEASKIKDRRQTISAKAMVVTEGDGRQSF